jgi:hypothetical protein
MDRIANGTQVASLPTPATAVGTPGYGTNGDPGAGLLGSIFGADEFNPLQEELMAFLTAAGVAPSRTVHNKVLAAATILFGPGRLLNVQTLSASGTYTPTVGMAKCRVRCVGGGGAGGGATNPGAGNISLGAPGTAGTYAEAVFTAADIGASKAATIGAAGVAASGAAGTNGTATSLGALVTTPGGVGGGMLNNQAPGVPSGNGTLSAAATGTFLFAKRGGAPVPSLGLSATAGNGGAGGDSPFGTGGSSVGFNAGGAGAAGFGAGGSGCCIGPGGAATGGAATGGFMIIEEFS